MARATTFITPGNSDWGDGNVAEFRLRHIGPGVHVGWSYLREREVNLNLWLLVR